MWPVGRGLFLVAAFDVFKERYTQLHLKLRELAPSELLTFDISHQILTCNLFGVDINAESIEITKLSLWLKTAEQGRQLAGLDANFYQGNSLVEDPAVDALAFDWGQRYPFIFTTESIATNAYSMRVTCQNDDHKNDHKQEQNSGFDVIIGNPPYVRQELLGSLKPYLQTRYKSFHGVADLYVYFYELGLSLLKDGGRLGFISSSSFFKTSSGEPLRRLLRERCQLEVLVDFGDWQVFEGVTTYPAVVVAHKTVPDNARMAHFLQLAAPVADLSAHFADNKQVLDLSRLKGSVEWQLEGDEAAALRAKLLHGHPSLKQAVGAPLYGIKTGLNEAFVIDRATRDRLVFADVASEGLFKPFLKGDDIERWRLESQDLWLILCPKGWTRQAMPTTTPTDEASAWAWLQQRHLALAAWLAPFADAARQRTDQGEYWWELRACAYYAKFEQPKVIYPDMAQGGKFCFDTQGAFSGNTAFFLPTNEPWYAALLNSKTVWFYLSGICTALRGGQWRLRMLTQHIETLPIPPSTPAQQEELSALAIAASQTAQERLTAQRNFARRITDLLPSPPPKGAQTTLGDRLSQWWQLPDFKAFQTEVTKRFKADIPLRQRNDWEALFTQEKTRIHQLGANIAATERSINTLVYALFGLTPAEIALIEHSVK